MRYDLGSGVANLTSPEPVEFNQWHSVKVTRNGPYGTLQLNTGQVVSGMSPGSLTELNLELPLYLGGYRFAYTLNKDSGVVTGLEGALQRLIVNGNAIEDLVEVALDSRGISRYVGLPCDSEYSGGKNELQAGSRKVAKCKNGGICTPFFRSYVCKCKADFIGPKCEKSKNFHALSYPHGNAVYSNFFSFLFRNRNLPCWQFPKIIVDFSIFFHDDF